MRLRICVTCLPSQERIEPEDVPSPHPALVLSTYIAPYPLQWPFPPTHRVSSLPFLPCRYEKLACNGDPLCGSLLASPSRARPRPADALNRADDGRETGATPAEMPSKPARKSASAVRQQSIKRVAAAATTKR
eukprot:scaffold1394_cov109-Isochrysis_galbana.AAC.35